MQKSEDAAIRMKNINYIIGSDDIETTPLQTYSINICEFLNELSSKLIKSPILREYPDLSSLAFWARKANIQKIKKLMCNDLVNRMGRGLCFHITPSNIAINSIFSYFFSLLAGNANIVRLPGKDFPQINYICNLIKDSLKNYPEIEKRTAFIKYDRDDEINAMYSALCDCRMIWGGDKTISTFKNYTIKPRCIDITFPDRYSICIINAESINQASQEQMLRLADNFYNDTYLMDQNACSSPMIIYWLNDNKDGRNKFWNYIADCVKQKYNFQDAMAVDKYTKLCEDAIHYNNLGDISTDTNLLYRYEIKKLTPDIYKLRGKCGYFYEYSLKNFNELYKIINEKYQTVTYYGINPELLKEEIISNNLKGIDRIVPIGQAMDIDVNWDGYNIIYSLSREIIVK